MGQRFPFLGNLRESFACRRSGSDGELASAQEAIIDASLAGLALLDWLGAEGALAAGHSVGELTALCWAGALDEEAVRALARARARATAALPGMGAMVSITASTTSLTQRRARR